MTSAVERAISAVRTIRASGAEEREGHAVDGYAQEAYRAGMRIARLQAMINPITSTTIQVAFLVVLGLGGPGWPAAPSRSVTWSRSSCSCSCSGSRSAAR